MKKLIISPRLQDSNTDLCINKGILKSSVLEDLCQTISKNRVIIAATCMKKLGCTLSRKVGASLLLVPDGEKAKTYAVKMRLEKALFKKGCGRDTVLIALGGGTTTDLVGFLASEYMRGVPLILIPTTLLAMTDAAIGGKTGINLPFGKNLIGSFYHPKAILIDSEVLDSLPEKERLNGYAEILKMGLVFDPCILELSTKSEEVIERAIHAKIRVITEDPHETGLRRILNFGHTIGHALETLSKYKMAHGHAVALGSLAEAHLSYVLGFLKHPDFEKLSSLYQPFSLKLPKGYQRTSLLKAMLHDKKNATGQIRCVLIDRLGHACPFDGAYCRVITAQEMSPTLTWMEKIYG